MGPAISMDTAVVTCRRDLGLLRLMLTSYARFCRTEGSLLIFHDEDDGDEIRRMDLPPRHRLIAKQSLGIPGDDFRRQMAIKLNIDLYTDKDYVWVIDSDYLLLDFVSESDFFAQGRPIWLMRPWDNEPSLRWRKPTADVLGFEPPYQFMDRAQYVFARPVLQRIREAIPREKILHPGMPPSEFMIYGAFAHRHTNDAYEWRFVDDAAPSLSYEVNQRPPTYAELDPHVGLAAAAGSKYCVFWSYWILSEIKMVEFLRDACAAHGIDDSGLKARLDAELTASRDRLIGRLCADREAIDADRRAKDDLIGRLSREIAAINEDRSAKDDLINRLVREIEIINDDREKKDHVIRVLSGSQ